MRKSIRWRNIVIGVGLVLVFFASAHLIDDFLVGVPEDFGLNNPQAQVLAGLFHAQWMIFFVLVAQEKKSGYYGTLFWGAFLALAGTVEHLSDLKGPLPYGSGAFSEVLIIGLIAAGIAQAVVSTLALRQTSASFERL